MDNADDNNSIGYDGDTEATQSDGTDGTDNYMLDEIDNLDEIVEAIFSKPPGPPGSVQLQLEDETAQIAQETGVNKFIFNILFLISYKGMVKLFGKENFIDMSAREFEILRYYILSCGYDVKLYANDTTLTPWELVANDIQVRKYNIEFNYTYSAN